MTCVTLRKLILSNKGSKWKKNFGAVSTVTKGRRRGNNVISSISSSSGGCSSNSSFVMMDSRNPSSPSPGVNALSCHAGLRFGYRLL